MINPFTLIKEVYDASEAGQQLATPEVWTKRASAIAALSTLIGAGLAILAQFTDIALGLTDADIQQIASGIAVVGVAIADRLHVASNPNAGRAPRVRSDS